jgi:hypothetical protein
MPTDLRRLGISATTVSWGTHLCHFYESTQDLLAATVPYFQAGLETNEFCVWTIPESVRAAAMDALGRAVPDVDRYLAERQLEIIPIRDWYLAGGTFDGARVSSAWFQKLDEARVVMKACESAATATGLRNRSGATSPAMKPPSTKPSAIAG